MLYMGRKINVSDHQIKKWVLEISMVEGGKLFKQLVHRVIKRE